MFVGRNFKWIFIPIIELSGFFPKYNHIYFSCLTNAEIFSRFAEPFWLLLLLLAAINRAVVVGNGTYPNLTLPFLPILPHLTSPYLTIPNLTLNLTIGTDYDD